MNDRQRLITLAGVALAVSIYVVLHHPRQQSELDLTPTPRPLTRALERESTNRLAVSAEPSDSTSIRGAAHSPSATATSATAVTDEFIIAAEDTDALLALTETITANGGTIIDQIPGWNTVRIRMRVDAFDTLLETASTLIADYDFNYIAHVPPAPIDTGPASPYVAFGQRALAWLGADADRSDWGAGVVVAVLDTAVEPHPEFVGTTIAHIDMMPESDGTSDPGYYGHGTAVASAIAGANTGVAPAAALISVRVLADDGEGDTFTIAKGIIEAVDRGADIINLSLGSYGDSGFLHAAVEYALDNDVAIVAAVGNDGANGVVYPAAYDGVVAVSAVDAHEQHLPFANTGESIDISAPGLGVYAAWPEEQQVWFSGTSVAAPLVAGSIARVMAEDPMLSSAEAVAIVLANSDDNGAPGHDPIFGHGVLDLGRITRRETAGIHDAAAAGHYFPDPLTREHDWPVVLSVENRGTETLTDVLLEYEFHDQIQSVRFSDLAPGTVASHTIVVPVSSRGESPITTIISRVLIANEHDVLPGNNVRSTTITVPATEHDDRLAPNTE